MEDAGPFDRLGPPRVSIWAKSAQLVQPLEAGHGIAGAAGELNAKLFGQLKRIEQAGPGRSEGSALVAALLLGRAGEIDPESRSLFRRTGLAHLLSISGLHVALLLALADRLGAALGLGIRARLAVGGAIALFFVPFAGASPPLVRAAAVAVLFAAARLLERPVSPLPILALAAAVELAARPEHLFDAGFQLTYAAAAGLALAASPLARRFARLPRFLAGALAATFAAELAVAPLVLARFGALPLAGFAANVLLVPLFLLAAALGAAALLLGNVSSPLAGGLLGWSSAITRAGEAGLGHFADLPLALLRPSPAGAWLLAAGCAGLFVLAALRRPFPGWLVLAPAAFCVAGALVRPAGPRPGEFRVAALDVGQGDAILVRSARATMLVDGGGSARVSPESFAETVLLPALARRGVRRLDRVVLTHPHPDHCVGLLGLLKEERVGELALPAVPDLGGCLADLRTAAAARGTPIVTARGGDHLPLGDLAIDVLAPGRDRMEWTRGETNERSLVMRVSNGGGTALLAGDLQSWGEHELVEAGGALRADLLKVSHHGSRTSSSEPFLDAVHPRVAVVSCGRRNVYGHPSPEVVERFVRRRVPLLRTDRRGPVEVTLRRGPTSLQTGD